MFRVSDMSHYFECRALQKTTGVENRDQLSDSPRKKYRMRGRNYWVIFLVRPRTQPLIHCFGARLRQLSESCNSLGYWSEKAGDKTLLHLPTIVGRPNINTVFVHSVDGHHRPLRVPATRCTGFLHFFCESVHLRFTLWSLQTSAEADAEQERCYS